ncbi:unnamed protein product [Phytophthora lilii]|uniref:Unnamed protein product n=1 Tax=Phytophthora lilii TaxID=2077276 RepID=A0A9W6THV8_9STRA|nr:unnamed protein product [Phytophthora lilii]
MLVEEDEFALRPDTEDPSLQPTFIAMNQQKEAQELVAQLPELVQKYRHGQKEKGEDIKAEDEEEDWMDLFDGCVVYLLGFPPQMNSLLQRIIRSGMGTIYHSVVIHQVTHVIVSASLSDKQTLEAIRARVVSASAEGNTYFVSASWLLDCVKCSDLQPEELYPVEFDVHAPEPAGGRAIPVEGNTMVQTPVKQRHIEAQNETSSDLATHSDDLLQNGDISSILTSPEKALPTRKRKRTHIFEGYSFLLLCRDPEDTHMIKPMLKNIRGDRGGAEAIALAGIDFPRVDPEQFAFVSHVVMCTGVVVDEKEALEMQQRIHEIQRSYRNNGGDQEDAEHTHKDSGINRKRRQRMLLFVSDLWVNCSLAARTKLSFASHELLAVSENQPRAIFTSAVPLPGFQDVVASSSVYRDIELLVVTELLRIAGAHVPKNFTAHNTHLVCLKPLGMKYIKASKYGLHIVKARWVVDSLLSGKRLSENNPDFQVVDGDESSSFTHIAREEATQSPSATM